MENKTGYGFGAMPYFLQEVSSLPRMGKLQIPVLHFFKKGMCFFELRFQAR
jgi:hypothetical protein